MNEIIQSMQHYDVVVVGGGAAGIAAAVGSAQRGARTLIIDKNPYFGGAATHSSVLSFCGFFTQSNPPEQVVGGVGQRVLEHLKDLNSYNGPRRSPRTGTVVVLLDPEYTKVALDRCVQESGVIPLLHTFVIGAHVEDGNIHAVECINHAGRFTVTADAFVDASGEADLAAFSGGQVRVGDADGHLQSATLMMRIGGVRAETNAHPDVISEAIQKGKQHGISNLTKELGTILRMPFNNDVLCILADEYVNGLDSWDLTRAEMSARAQAMAYIEAFRLFLPGFEHAYLVQTGPQIGVRETRHIVSQYTLTGNDVLQARRQDDAIARGAWPVELHTVPGAPNEWHQIANQSFYDIPLRSLSVRPLKNLWAGGRIIDCDTVAFASARVMGTAFATGQAAGVAAALHADGALTDPLTVRSELLKQGAII